MADRVLVMHEGRITAQLSREEADEERVDPRRDRTSRRARGMSIREAMLEATPDGAASAAARLVRP